MALLQRPRTEADDAPALVSQRKGDPRPEAVVQGPRCLLRALRESRIEQLALTEAALSRSEQHSIVGARRPADPEAAQHLLREPPPREVLARARRLRRVPQAALVVRTGPLEQLEQALLAPAARGRLRVLLGQLELDVVALREPFDRAREVEPLRLAREIERVTGGLAAEAVVELLGGRHRERRRALLVERTKPGVGVGARAAQLGPRPDQIEQVHRLAHALEARVRVAGHQPPNERGTASSSKARMQ